MQLSVLCLPPLRQIFQTVPMTLPQWGTVLALAVTPVVVCELAKAAARRKASPKSASPLRREKAASK